MSEHGRIPGLIKKTVLAVVSVFLLVIVSGFILEASRNNAGRVARSLGLNNEYTAPSRGSLSFRIDLYGGVPVGRTRLINNGVITYKGKEVYHLTGLASSLKISSSLFNARAEVNSYIDKDKLHTVLFKQKLILPDKPIDEKEITYDQDNLVMESKGVKRQILPDTQDPLSAMFYIGQQPLAPGKEFDININTNQKNYRLFLKVLNKEELVVNGKKAGIWVVKGDIKRRDKSPRHTTTLTMWLLDNPSKTPLVTKVFAGGMLVTARLIAVK